MFGRKVSKFTLSLLAVAVATMFLWVSFLPATAPEAPDEIMIHSKLWAKKKYEDAKLTHKKHATDYNIPCADCHHVYQDGKNVWKEGDKVQRCDECHTCVKTKKELKTASEEEKKLSLYIAFHDNCQGCHKKHNTETKTKDAPTSCSKCHKKIPTEKK